MPWHRYNLVCYKLLDLCVLISGLVTLDEMKARQDLLVKEREKQIAASQEEAKL